MKRLKRIFPLLLALALVLTLLPAVAFAEEGTGDTAPQLTAKFSSNPNKRTALPLTLAEGDQLSINGVAIETVLGPKGNPLISAGALATAAVLSENADASGRVEIPVKKIGELAEEAALKDILVASDGRFITYPAQGAGNQEGLSEKDYALLLAVRKGMNNPNYGWWNLLNAIAEILKMPDASAKAFDLLSERWSIPAEKIRELMDVEDTYRALERWLYARNGEDAERLNNFKEAFEEKKNDPALAGEVNGPESRAETEIKKRLDAYFIGRKEVQDLIDINGQTFTIGVNGVSAGTLAPTVWQDDLTPPPYHDPSYDKAGEASATDVTPVDGTRDLPPDGVIPDS